MIDLDKPIPGCYQIRIVRPNETAVMNTPFVIIQTKMTDASMRLVFSIYYSKSLGVIQVEEYDDQNISKRKVVTNFDDMLKCHDEVFSTWRLSREEIFAIVNGAAILKEVINDGK